MKSPRLRRVISLVLAAVCLGSGAMFVRRLLDYRTGDAAYAEAAQIAALPEPEPETTAEPAPEPSAVETPSAPQTPAESAPAAIDLPALQAVNADVIGWISIPDTAISYPLVQGSDNDYYLTHTWNRVSSAVGAIFLDARCPSDLGGFNTILYGHRMRNGSMFAALKNYSSQAFWRAHPRIYLTDAAGTHTFDIYAACEVSTEGEAYRLDFSGDDDKQAFLRDGLSRSVISTGLSPTASDRILTLSTCTGRGHATRWVVQAVYSTLGKEKA